MAKRPISRVVYQFMLNSLGVFPGSYVIPLTAQKFGISSQAVQRRMRRLVAQGHVLAEGRTKNRTYKPVFLDRIEVHGPSGKETKEDEVWRNFLAPHLPKMKTNVRDVCYYGLTEIVNNAIDHSEGRRVDIRMEWTVALIRMVIQDDGVGIFQKINRDLNLEDERHALLELSKGKLTTDPEHHTGEGIFFCSRAFDHFSIRAGALYFTTLEDEGDWLIEVEDRETTIGSYVTMQIALDSEKILKELFDRFSSEEEDYGFYSTHVPVGLVKYGDENLISRSQAKRLLARFDRFREVLLDFKGVSMIGQAFADEIFRVFKNENPRIEIIWINACQDVEKMIKRARQADFNSLGNQ